MKKFALLLGVLMLLVVVAACAAPAAAPTSAPPTAAPAAPTAAPAAPTAAPAAPTTAPAAPTTAPAGAMTPVTLQLQWVPQSQFCGYYAALDKGFWKDEGLDVTIKPGAVEIVPQQVVATGGADFGVAWLPKVLASIEQGADLVNISQPFQRSGTTELSWKDTGIAKPEDWKRKKVGRGALATNPNCLPRCAKSELTPTTRAT